MARFIFKDNWPSLLNTLGSIGLALSGLFIGGDNTSRFWWVFFFVAATAVLAGNFVSWARAPRIGSLERDNEALKRLLEEAEGGYFGLLSNVLSVLANEKLNFGDKERISVYKHDGSAFVMIGRYSKHPEYCKKGRSIYPDSQGAIGAAWNSGEAVVSNLPDPKTEFNSYCQMLARDWDIERTTVEGFKMQSRNYVAFALENPTDSSRVAVIVFESRESDTLQVDNLRSELINGEGRRILQFLDKMYTREPSPTWAKKEGY